ncbi:MAG: 7-cyano-7-deazaguanine synthase QueC [Gammaproteobacteria bacterium]|nr:7-cyano-7-deazaguanine synthase QueC [Gammaproteobacteria bacterium]
MKKAIILFSGGLDSTTCLAYAKSQGFNCYALSFNYGQRHAAELNAAKRICTHMGVQHIIIPLPLSQMGGSALTDVKIEVPDFKGGQQIPVTYVPARNTIFLSFALGWAEVLKAKDIFIGVSAIDYSSYPDCRPEYIQTFQTLANLATKIGVEEGEVRLHAPLIYLSKADTIKLGLSLGIDYQMTISCYQATDDGRACGKCDSCVLRMKGFREAQVSDLTCYV